MNYRDAKSYFKDIAQHYQPWRLSLLLTVAALVLWVFSIFQAHLVLDDWGIIHSLPPSYFIALALLTVASGLLWLSRQNHDLLLCLQLCFFIAMLWITPLLLETTLVSTRFEFGYYSNTPYVINSGHLNPTGYWTHNWPSLPLLQTALVDVLGIKNPDQMLIWAPFILLLIMVLPLYLFFRNIMGRCNYCWAAIWIFYLFNHVGQFFFGHQTIALFLLWTLLALLLRPSNWGESTSTARRLVIILIMVGLTITHLFTCLLLLFVMVSLWLTRRQRIGTLVILFAVLTASWTMFVATGFFSAYTPQVFERLFNLDLLWGLNVGGRAALGSEGHLWVANIRIWFTALIGVIGLAGLGLSRKFKSGADGTILAVAGGTLLMVPFGFYAGEMISRAYLFMLPVVAYFGVRLLRTKASALILLILLVVALPFSIISLHGNQAIDHISPSQRAYWQFTEEKTTQGYYTGGGMVMSWSFGYLNPKYYDPGISAEVPTLQEYTWSDALFAGEWPPGGGNAYVSLSSYEKAMYEIMWDNPQGLVDLCSWLNSSRHYNLIYASGDVSSYMSGGGR